MKDWFLHWIIRDAYDPVWPNIVASAIVGSVLWIKLHAIHRHLKGKSK